VASGGAAGSTSVTLVSATGFATGDWAKYGSGELSEYHQVDSVATNTLTNRTPFLRTQAVGTVVVEQVQTPFAGISPEGVRWNFGGAVEKLRSATKKFSIGVRPGTVSMNFSFGIIEISLANFAYALGIAQSQVAGGRLPVNSNLGTATLDGLYLKGLTQDAANVQVDVWGSSLDIAQVATVINNQGPAAVIPLTAKPASAFRVMQWT
jgi:hypothetical protein